MGELYLAVHFDLWIQMDEGLILWNALHILLIGSYRVDQIEGFDPNWPIIIGLVGRLDFNTYTIKGQLNLITLGGVSG